MQERGGDVANITQKSMSDLDRIEEVKKWDVSNKIPIRTKEYYLKWLEDSEDSEIASTPLITYYEPVEDTVVQMTDAGEEVSIKIYDEHGMSPFFFALVHKKYDMCRKLLAEKQLGHWEYIHDEVLENGSEYGSRLKVDIYRYFLMNPTIPQDIKDIFWDIRIDRMRQSMKLGMLCEYIQPLEYMPENQILYAFCEDVDLYDYQKCYEYHFQLLEEFLFAHDDIGKLFSLKHIDLYRYGMRTNWYSARYIAAQAFPRFMNTYVTDVQMQLLEMLFRYHRRDKKRLQSLLSIMPVNGIANPGPHSSNYEEYISSLLKQVKMMAKAYQVDRIRKRHFFNFLFEITVCVKGQVSETLYQEFVALTKEFYSQEFLMEDILLKDREGYGYYFPLHTAIEVLKTLGASEFELHLDKKKHYKRFADMIDDMCDSWWDPWENLMHINVDSDAVNRMKMWLADVSSLIYDAKNYCPYDWRKVLNTKNSELLYLLLQKGMYPLDRIEESICHCMECGLQQLVPLLLIYQK